MRPQLTAAYPDMTPVPYTTVCIALPGPIFHGRYVGAQNKSALETSRRELSGDVSFGIGTLLVVEQSSFENRPRGA